jgi:tetratricopeptide (TPR) repeat protein
LLKAKTLSSRKAARKAPEEPVDPRLLSQRKAYEQGIVYFQHQKFHKAQQAFLKVVEGPSSEIADRARVHLRICEMRIARPAASNARSGEEHYHQGIAMMNLGRWDEAREHLERARKLAAKADYIHYAMAALDCLVGESDSALKNLKVAIELRPENRYHARNDEDFASLFEDPRFTELLYPEREGSAI